MLDPAIFGDTCAAPTCERRAEKKGYCSAHFLRWLRGADLSAPIRRRRRKGEPRPACSAPRCYREAHARGLCPAHLRRKEKGIESDKPIQPRRPREATCDFSVRILRETRDVLQRQARAMGISQSDLVRTVLEGWARNATSRKREY